MLLTLTMMAATPLLPPICKAPERTPVEGSREARPKKLGELPPADHFYTVYVRENGCMIPVKVRDRR